MSAVAEVVDPPRFPAVVEDLAVIVNEDVPAAQVEQTVLRAGGNLLRGARIFDVYRGEQIGAGKKSLAFSLTYQYAGAGPTDFRVLSYFAAARFITLRSRPARAAGAAARRRAMTAI